MDRAVEIDMMEWLSVEPSGLDGYYTAIRAGEINNESPVRINSDGVLAAQTAASYCRFNRLPRNVGELEVMHRCYHAFKIIENHDGKTDLGLGESAEYVRATYPRLFEDAKKSHRAMHPPLRMRRDGELTALADWLEKNDTLSVWSTKPDSFYKF